jgi:hypothetical protein
MLDCLHIVCELFHVLFHFRLKRLEHSLLGYNLYVVFMAAQRVA